MESAICTSCRRPKGVLSCELCQCSQCKKCAQILPKDSFSFLNPTPAELQHRTYCGACYDEKIAPALLTYQQTMARARGVFVFFKSKGEETRLMKRTEKPIRVQNCPDREETLLRLAFVASQANFNCLVDVHITSSQVRNAGWQSSMWQGIAIPTKVDGEKLDSQITPR